MYEAHFGLKKPLFQTGIAEESSVFLAPRHQQLAASIKLALTTSDSAVVLTGPAGVGKTALMSTVLRTTSPKLALGWITVAPANAAELLELLLAEFGFNAHRVGRVERMQMWRQFLNEMSATSSRVYVIAERAEDLGADLLRALDSLTAADPNGSLGANLVLLGQPALLDMLRAPTLASMCQRIRLLQRLEPLTPDELRAYLDHHAKAAGGALDKLFARDALVTLHEITGGVPRLVNNVAETALTLAATRKDSAVTAQLLREVAQMFGIAPAQARPTSAEPAREAAAATRVAQSVAVAQPAPVAAQPSAPAARPAAPTQGVVQPPASAATPSATAAPAPASAAPARATPIAPATVAPSPSTATTPRPAFAATASAAPAPAASVPARPAPVARAPAAPAPVVPAPPARAPVAPAPVVTAPVARAPVAPSPIVPAAAAPALAATAPAAAQPRPAARDRQFMSDEEIDSFAATMTESPDVPTFDFPVLTDAVDPPRQRPRAETAYVKPPAPRANTPEPPKPAAPLPRVVAAASTPPAARVVQPPQPPPKPAPPAQPAVAEDADLLRQTQTMRAISVAKSIDDISNSMAETLFSETDLGTLSEALAASGWTDDEASAAAAPPASPAPPPSTTAKPPAQAPAAKSAPAPAAKSAPQPPTPKPAPPPADDDPFDFLGLGRDAPLELIDDVPIEPQQRKEAGRNR